MASATTTTTAFRPASSGFSPTSTSCPPPPSPTSAKKDDGATSPPPPPNTTALPATTNYHEESETEDEEVKMNTIGGVQGGVDDSDMNFTDDDCEAAGKNDDDDLSDEEEEEETPEGGGVVNFVSNRPSEQKNAVPLVRPTASSPPRLSPLDEEGEEEEEEEESDAAADSGVEGNNEDAAAEDDGDDDDSASTSSSSSGGCARGVPLSLDANSVMSDEEDDDDNEKDLDDEAGYTAGDDDEEEEIEGDEEQDDLVGKEVPVAFDGMEEDEEEDDDDVELSGILQCLCDQSPDAATANQPDEYAEEIGEDRYQHHILGVTQDRQQHQEQDRVDSDLITVPKPKRVLSFNALTALSDDIGCIRDSPKRQKNEAPAIDEEGAEPHQSSAAPAPFHGFSLGPPAVSASSGSFAAGIPKCVLPYRKRRESFAISSSDDEEVALDRQLGEELEEELVQNEEEEDDDDKHRCNGDSSRQKSPVPLLTPPESPVTVEMNGEKATICEWPSNLAVDSAMVAAINETWPSGLEASRSMSPSSVDGGSSEPAPAGAFAEEPSMLTPMLRGISVTSR